ncbi:uncharacterized protein LOC141651056 [Silene latifolia]|uniref:uncharacterized protein LOC141651056 n=1 Tax=Silene latifolia TaxID=37657 RepID=UPI003D785A53
MGFDDSWTDNVMKCVSTVSFSIKVNGLLTEEFRPSRDDNILLVRAEEPEVRKVKEILSAYKEASGQLVNYNKTTVSFSKGTGAARRAQIAQWLGVRAVEEHDKYVGLPTVVGHSKHVIARVIRDKLCRKLQGWKGMLLSKAGREILIKAVAQSISTYVMSVFKLPHNFCDELRSLVSRFWWGSENGKKKISWLAWSKLCQPKCRGGLGFRNFHEFNLTLLGKHAWRMLTERNRLMVRVLGGKYFAHKSFMKADLRVNLSYTWRSIFDAKEVLMVGLRRHIGNGLSTGFWYDPWLRGTNSRMALSPMRDADEGLLTADLLQSNGIEWNLTKRVRELMGEMDALEERGAKDGAETAVVGVGRGRRNGMEKQGCGLTRDGVVVSVDA